MRQSPAPLREPTAPAVRASWAAALARPQAWRGVVIAVVAGAFLALVGAFGTYELPIGLRLAYWLGLAVAGALAAGPLTRPIQRRAVASGRPWLWGAIMAVGLSIPFTIFVWLVTSLVFGWGLHLARLPGFFPSVLLVTAAITGLNFLAQPRTLTASAAPDGAAPPRFLERLPLKLRGGELWAVEAEDHYLRLHTSKGQDLILFRLSDAVAELEGIEGARTHRSWWVARSAVVEVRRGDGRAVLTLKDGARIPVSRAYARTLRAAGWF
jgi:hypothetical protein